MFNCTVMLWRKTSTNIFCCSNDYLIINSSHTTGIYCGQKTGETVLFEGKHVVITFHSDDNDIQKRGFLLSFTAVKLGKYLSVNQLCEQGKQNGINNVAVKILISLHFILSTSSFINNLYFDKAMFR